MTAAVEPKKMPNEPVLTPNIIAEHGLTSDEYQLILKILEREPNLTELGIFSAMWSEHCSYKSSKVWLKTLPTKAPHVIQGPGEGAGVIDIGDGKAAIFKIESHNSPSAIEPVQGAATGVGGILRDIFSMGARPVANLNALRFGDPSFSKTKGYVGGVVKGIGGYGNCIGIPTVAGECEFHPAYNRNPLVNAMSVGIAEADKIFYSKATGVGNLVIYVGSKTGRDGIHGATMSSAELKEDMDEKRPTVQVGDPFVEKLLLEACLEVMATDHVVAVQDMGAAGLTCSAVEMADKGGLGLELNLNEVPQREKGMTPYEMMLSESQERMLLVIKPESIAAVTEIFAKWDLDCAVIGQLTDTGQFVLKYDDETVCDIPVSPLVLQAPEYERPYKLSEPRAAIDNETLQHPMSVVESLKTLMGKPNFASKRWIWEQYDHTVMGDTIQRPGGDAAVVRVHGTNKALAMTTDCSPRYCLADPLEGGKQAVAESYRNLVAVGAKPMAITNNLNFGSPEKQHIMGQFVGCVTGMKEACEALDYPVISGNVSFYNETEGQPILPTPVVGGVGVIKDLNKSQTLAFKNADDVIFVLGKTKGEMGASAYLRDILGREDGQPPKVDLSEEKTNAAFVLSLHEQSLLSACHDISEGGLAIAVAEMAMAGNFGASISLPEHISAHIAAFCEDQARYVFTADAENADKISKQAEESGVSIFRLGRVTADTILAIQDNGEISVQDLKDASENWLPSYMAS